MSFKTSLMTFWLYKSNFSQFHHFVPVFIFPDAEPFHQILGALEFGVKAIFLPFESGHILHRHAGKKGRNKREHKGKSSHLTSFPEVTAAFWYFKISITVCKLNGKERFDLLSDQRRVATPHGPQIKAKISPHRAPCDLAPKCRCGAATKKCGIKAHWLKWLPWAPNGGDILPARSIFRPKQKKIEEKKHTHMPSGPLHPVTPSKHLRAIIVTGSHFKRKGLTLGKNPAFTIS